MDHLLLELFHLSFPKTCLSHLCSYIIGLQAAWWPQYPSQVWVGTDPKLKQRASLPGEFRTGAEKEISLLIRRLTSYHVNVCAHWQPCVLPCELKEMRKLVHRVERELLCTGSEMEEHRIGIYVLVPAIFSNTWYGLCLKFIIYYYKFAFFT